MKYYITGAKLLDGKTRYESANVLTRDTEHDVYMNQEFANPTMEKLVYDQLYGWETLYFDMPAPFYTYVESEGYGPNGKIGKTFYERMI